MNQRERSQKVVLKIQWNIVVKVLEYGDYEQETLQDLVSLLQQSLDQVEATEEACTPHHMKNKLKGHFGDDIYFTEIPGKSDVVVLRRNVSKLLHTFYTSTSGADVSSQTEPLLKTAGQLILSEIKAMPNARTYYPRFDDDHSVCEQVQYLPPSFQNLLREIFKNKDGEMRVASLGQAIIQADRPRTAMVPLQLGLAVQVHHRFGSRGLVETLHRLGFCVPYNEVQVSVEN